MDQLPLTGPQLRRTWPATQAHALTCNRTSNPLVRRAALNPLSHTSQGTKEILLNVNGLFSSFHLSFLTQL